MNPLVDPGDFPASHTWAYLDAANMALTYRGADEAVRAWQKDVAYYGSIHFDDDAEATVFDELHVAAARLFKATPDDIAAGSSATELLSSLAWALAPDADTNVVSTATAFPSTVYPWRRVAQHTGCELRLARGQKGYTGSDDLLQLIDPHTAVVCVSHVEYSGGQRFDLATLADAAHARGALLVVDASQSAGALPIDAPGTGIDALVCGSYKWLCGPFGAAVMYLAPPLHTTLEPGLIGFRSHREMWDLRADRLRYPEAARRFEFSTMAYGCALGMTEAITFLLDIGIERIFRYNRLLSDRLIQGLEARHIEITSPRGEAERTSIVTARFPGRDPARVAATLKAARVMVSCRKDIVRFTPHLYNTPADIDRVLACIDDGL